MTLTSTFEQRIQVPNGITDTEASLIGRDCIVAHSSEFGNMNVVIDRMHFAVYIVATKQTESSSQPRFRSSEYTVLAAVVNDINTKISSYAQWKYMSSIQTAAAAPSQIAPPPASGPMAH